MSTAINTSQWDYGQRKPDFASWSDVVRNYYSRLQSNSPFTWTTNLGAQQSQQQNAGQQRFWREILAKDQELNRQYERLRDMLPSMTKANLGRLNQYETSFDRNAPLSSAINARQIEAAMSPFTGGLQESLRQARQNWAASAGQQADAARAGLTGLVDTWNKGRTEALGSLRDALGRQLEQSTSELNKQLERAYGMESGINREYGQLRNRLAQINQNRAMNQLLASVSPGMGSAMSDFTTRASMRMAQDAAAQDAAAINQLQRESLLRRLSGEMGVLDRRAQLQRGDIQDLSRLGMAQQDMYTQQMLNLSSADDARRRQIIDQILGSGALSDIGYVTGVQSQMLGRPQALLNAETQSYLAPVQARQAVFGNELGMVPRAAEALHAANWLAVGTPGNQGGFPVYANPPNVPPPANVLAPYFDSFSNIGYLSSSLSPVADFYRLALNRQNQNPEITSGSTDYLYALGQLPQYNRIYS